MVLRANTVAESLNVDWLSNVPCVSINNTATWEIKQTKTMTSVLQGSHNASTASTALREVSCNRVCDGLEKRWKSFSDRNQLVGLVLKEDLNGENILKGQNLL